MAKKVLFCGFEVVTYQAKDNKPGGSFTLVYLAESSSDKGEQCVVHKLMWPDRVLGPWRSDVYKVGQFLDADILFQQQRDGTYRSSLKGLQALKG